jgi:hypothetical protein
MQVNKIIEGIFQERSKKTRVQYRIQVSSLCRINYPKMYIIITITSSIDIENLKYKGVKGKHNRERFPPLTGRRKPCCVENRDEQEEILPAASKIPRRRTSRRKSCLPR